MSRIGRKPINIPAGVTVSVNEGVVTVKGPKGELTQKVHPNMTVESMVMLLKLSVLMTTS